MNTPDETVPREELIRMLRNVEYMDTDNHCCPECGGRNVEVFGSGEGSGHRANCLLAKAIGAKIMGVTDG